jgi:flagellar hook-length control protein FliK
MSVPIENAFLSIPTPVVVPERKTTSSAADMKVMKESQGKIDGIQEEAISFLSVLAHFAENVELKDLEPEKNVIVGSKDLVFSANETDETNENANKAEETSETSSFARGQDQETGSSAVSNPFCAKSVLDLLSSLEKDLDETGERALSNEAATRLETMLAKFRSLFNDPLSKTALADLKPMANAWAKDREKGETPLPSDLNGQVALEEQGQEKAEEVNLLLVSPLPADPLDDETAELSKSLAFSRFRSYLKTDASSKESAKTDASEENGEKNEKDKKISSEVSHVTGQGELAVPAFSVSPSQGEFSDEADAARGATQRKSGFSNRADMDGVDSEESRRLSSDESGKVQAQTRTKPGTEERKAGFERFFGEVMARRDGVREAGESLNLAKDVPLSRNEALREGLDNVVRFIRVSGEQKAALIVDPPALGRISVELTNSTVGLEASIKVGSEQVRQLIQDQLAQLRWSLERQGVQLTHFSVDVQQDNGRREQGRSADRERGVEALAGNGGVEREGESEETLFRVDLNQGLLYWVA